MDLHEFFMWVGSSQWNKLLHFGKDLDHNLYKNSVIYGNDTSSTLYGGYYGLRMSTPSPQCLEIFSLPL